MDMRLIKALFLIMLSSFGTLGQTKEEQLQIRQLDSLFRFLENNRMSMGSISIFKDGKEFYRKTYGYATIREDLTIPASEKTSYRIGSVTKLFTAVMIMQLIEANKLSLDQTIEPFFPDLKQAEQVTIRQMLGHRSLLPIYTRVDDLNKLRKTQNTQQLIAVVNKAPANSDTIKARYNNLNYLLLGLIAEQVTGKSYNEILDHMLKPIAGERVYGTYHLLDYHKNEANSFHIRGEKWIEDYEIIECPISDGSGFLLSDAPSLNRFMEELFAGKIIGKEYLERMLPVTGNFGYGLMKANFDSHKGYGHSGHIEGFTSVLSYFPEDHISISFLQNGVVYPMNDILILVGSILFGEPVEMPALQKIELSPEEEHKLLGIYVNEEEGYKVLVDQNKGELRLRLAKGKGLLNKMILTVYPLEKTRLFNPTQGILFDFSNPGDESFNKCEMRVNGARLILTRE